MYLVTWEVKETSPNGFIDIETVELICNSDQEVVDSLDEILLDQYPENPNIKVYSMEDTTGQFARAIAERNKPDRLQRLKEDNDRKIKDMFASKIA